MQTVNHSLVVGCVRGFSSYARNSLSIRNHTLWKSYFNQICKIVSVIILSLLRGEFSNCVFLTILVTEFLHLPWKESSPICRRRTTVICTPLLSSVPGILACSAESVCLQKHSQGLSDVTCGSFADQRAFNGILNIFLGEGANLFTLTNLPYPACFPSVSLTPPLQFCTGTDYLRSHLPTACVWLGVWTLGNQLGFLWTT